MNSTKNILAIGDHSSILCSENNLNTSTLRYIRGNVFENIKPQILINKISIECASEFDRNSLSNQLERIFKEESYTIKDVIAIGDPSELFTQASILSLIKLNSLNAVILIYPAAMTALDIRKEIAELIYLLHKHQIPTYLIREPKLFFDSFEPNMAAFVYGLTKEIHPTKDLTYLCGAKNFETTTV